MSPALTYIAAACAKENFLGLVPWYQYLNLKNDAAGGCSVDFSRLTGNSQDRFNDFLAIGLAIGQDLLRIAALVAVGYVIYGAVQYIISQGAPDATKKAQQTIVNALLGLGIAILAAVIVNFVGTRFV